MSSSEQSEVLEIMPLPSNPSISKAETDSFLKVQILVNTFFWLTTPPRLGLHFPLRTGGLGQGAPEVKITFQEVIGAHDITVVKAEEAEGFIQWLSGFLEGKGYTKPLPSSLGGLLEDYTTAEINFFAIDVIDTNSTAKTVEPLTYEFDTPRLYYPLRISNLFSGDTEISLFTLTTNPLGTDSALARTFSKKAQFQIAEEVLDEISPAVASVFSGNPYLCYYYFSGSLSSFNEDVLAENESATISSPLSSPASITFLGAMGLLFLCLFSMLLRSGNVDSLRIRWLQTISMSTGFIGVVLVCVGPSLRWGQAEFNGVLLPLNGMQATAADVFLDLLFLPLILMTVCCFIYVLLQGHAGKASVLLAALGMSTAIVIATSSTYLVNTNDGFFITLTGAISFALTGVLRWSINLFPSQPPTTKLKAHLPRVNLFPSRPPIAGFEAYLIRKLLKALFILFGVSWVVYWLFSMIPLDGGYVFGFG